MRRILRSATTLSAVLLASSAAVAIVGCGSSDAVSPQTQLAGTYTLRSFNGQGLPADIGSDTTTGSRFAVVSDVYVFNADATFTEQFVIRETPTTGASSAQSGSDSGRWVLTGTTLTATYTNQSYVTGAFTNGNTITISRSGVTAVYQK